MGGAEVEYIINSLLDTDFYKFTMGHLVFEEFKNVPVKYAFYLRTKGIKLTEEIDMVELKRQLDHITDLSFGNSEIHYIGGTYEYGKPMFGQDYLEFLKKLRLPSYNLSSENGNIKLEFSGPWSTAIYWETYALSIISELYYRKILEKMSRFQKDVVFAKGQIRIYEKINNLKLYPVTISDFGTRRRAFRKWQEYIVKVLSKELTKQFLGTSNVKLAMDYGLLPMGTSAHEMDMGISGVYHDNDEEIRNSHNKMLQLWYKHYREGLSIALTDTYGSDFFFSDMTREQAMKWKGLRQDSGNPFAFTYKAIQFYENHGVDPRTKMIVFSDGLNVETILQLYLEFHEWIKVSFGWGTNLTNDLGFQPLSMVVKLVESNGHGTVKLSDNIVKAIGKPEDIERFKKIFSYSSKFRETCTY